MFCAIGQNYQTWNFFCRQLRQKSIKSKLVNRETKMSNFTTAFDVRIEDHGATLWWSWIQRWFLHADENTWEIRLIEHTLNFSLVPCLHKRHENPLKHFFYLQYMWGCCCAYNSCILSVWWLYEHATIRQPCTLDTTPSLDSPSNQTLSALPFNLISVLCD